MSVERDANGMRDVDKEAFRQVCREKKLWILVRATNPHSLKYIGRPDYTPKPISVKSKTAQCNVQRPGGRGDYELRGLVVDPTVHFSAVDPGKLAGAVKAWWEFGEHHALDGRSPDSEFRVDRDPASRHFGCLMQRVGGRFCYLHGDYDLKDIVEQGTEDWNLALAWKHQGENHNEILLFKHDLWDIVRELNRRIGVEMVQHGSEAQYAPHSEDTILVFNPRGLQWVLKGQSAIETFYFNHFKGRAAGIRAGIAHDVEPDPELVRHVQSLGGRARIRDWRFGGSG
jgi:hypothetical protein